MKKALTLGLLFLASCSSAPTKHLYKNCESANEKDKACPLSSFCYCEEIPSKEIGKSK